jgi:hypothetical protein
VPSDRTGRGRGRGRGNDPLARKHISKHKHDEVQVVQRFSFHPSCALEGVNIHILITTPRGIVVLHFCSLCDHLEILNTIQCMHDL